MGTAADSAVVVGSADYQNACITGMPLKRKWEKRQSRPVPSEIVHRPPNDLAGLFLRVSVSLNRSESVAGRIA